MKKTQAPHHSLQHCFPEPRHRTSQMSPDGLKAKEDVYIHTMDYSVMKMATEIIPLIATRIDLGG